MLLRAVDRLGVDRIHVDQVLALLGDQDLARLAHLDLAQLRLFRKNAAQHVVYVHARAGKLLLGREFLDLDFHDIVLERAAAQAGAHVGLPLGELFAVLD